MDQLHLLAELAVSFGANVQPDQVVRINCEVGHIEMARAVAAAAYLRGARFVDLDIVDPEIVGLRALLASDEALSYAQTWPQERIRELDVEQGANVKLVGPTAPGQFDDIEPERLVAAMSPRSRVWRDVEYRVNNTIVPAPNAAWARWLRPELPSMDALDLLWEDIGVACRLDLPDPAGAWRDRFEELRLRALEVTELRLDRLVMIGPGTHLTIGLPASARWEHAGHVSERGIEHAWNVPSEEIYTVPHVERVDGHVRLTRPALIGGRRAEEVFLNFSGGRVVGVQGGLGLEALEAWIARDDGRARLGEVAIVDNDSRVGQLGQVFGLVLLDENTTCHLALGFGFPEMVDPSERHLVNDADDHLDVMIGGDLVDITGIDRAGREHRLLRDGVWLLGR